MQAPHEASLKRGSGSGEFCEIFKNAFLQNTSGRLLLKIAGLCSRVEIKVEVKLQRVTEFVFSQVTVFFFLKGGVREFPEAQMLPRKVDRNHLLYLKVHSQVWDKFLATEKPFKNDEKCFLFHLRSPFYSYFCLEFLVL